MTAVKEERILYQIKTKGSSKEYVIKNFQEFGFPNKKEAQKFCERKLTE